MPKRRAARRAAAEGGSRAPAVKVVLVSLALCLTASGLTWAGWGRTGTGRPTEPYGARPPAAPVPAPPATQAQNAFAPSNPSKEYVYAGGRLVATEEPAPQGQTITFAQPPDRTYGDAPFALSATASSGLSVSFAAAGSCTASGSTLTVTAAGTCTVTASQAGNASHAAAPNVARTFSIAKAGSTTTVTASDVTYDGQPHGGAATATGAGGLSQSLPVSYSGRNGTAYGPTTTAPTNAGDYTASASYGGGANHNASSGGKDFRILKAAATVTLSGLSQTYNGSPRSVTAATNPAGLGTVSVTYNGSATAPTNAGSYAVSATLSHQNYAGSASGTLVVAKAAATLTLSGLTGRVYNGSPQAVTVTTSPSGLNGVSVTYNGSAAAPANAGSYAVAAAVTDANYQGSASGTLTINKASATITLSNLAQTYDGSPKSAAAATAPAGLTGVSLTYNGSATPPTNAGSYAVSATLGHANYAAAPASGTLVINKASATVTLGGLTGQVYNGSPRSATATTTPAGLPVNISYSQGGTPVSAPTDAGSYAVTATVNHANYAGSAAGTLVIAKASAAITLGGLTGRVYDESPQAATAATSPAGLTGVTITYNGSTAAPTNAGSYAVAASLAHTNYSAPSVSGTMVVAKATPAVTWNDPADIAHGTALSAAQLNATANAAGTFAYTPGAGTVLGVGNNQQLSAAFTPADSANYNNASAGVRINVIGCATAGASSFTATSPIGMGKSSALSWNVPYATGVTVSGVAGSFGASGSTVVTPAATTTYTLAATSAPVCPNQPLTMQATVVVMPCPVAAQTSFTADSYLLQPGGTAQLDWSAPDAAAVHIYAMTACAPAQICTAPVYSGTGQSGSVSVSPAQTTTYVLWADNDALNCDRVEKQLTVETANSSCSPGAYFSTGLMPPGEYLDATALLEWSVPNATGVTITDQTGADYGSYGASGQIYVGTRFTTRTYTLRAQIAGPACSPFVLKTTVECSMDCSSPSGGSE